MGSMMQPGLEGAAKKDLVVRATKDKGSEFDLPLQTICCDTVMPSIHHNICTPAMGDPVKATGPPPVDNSSGNLKRSVCRVSVAFEALPASSRTWSVTAAGFVTEKARFTDSSILPFPSMPLPDSMSARNGRQQHKSKFVLSTIFWPEVVFWPDVQVQKMSIIGLEPMHKLYTVPWRY